MRSPWKDGSISRRWRMCSRPSSNRTELRPISGSSGVAFASPAWKTSGSPVKTSLIRPGSAVNATVPIGKRTVKRSPYRREQRSRKGIGRAIHSHIWTAAGARGPGGSDIVGRNIGSPAVRLEGQTAIVTGGASGIGAATCRRLAAEGARVAVCDVNMDGAREVAGDLGASDYEMDVTSSYSVRHAVECVERDVGPVSILVNNAGTDWFGFFKDTDEELWTRVV